MKAIVVGGGVAGMGAAWRLRKQGIDVILIEKEEDLGGRCRTFYWEGDWRIRGAFAFVGSEKNLIEQAKELEIYNKETIDDLTEYHVQYVIHNKLGPTRVESLAPTDILKSPLLGWKEKAALGLILPTIVKQLPKNDPRDITSAVELDTESAYDYIKRISPNFADYIMEPSMQAFCGYDKDDYSKAWLVWLLAGFSWSGEWWSFKERGVGHLSYAFEKNFKADPNVDLYLDSMVTELEYNENEVVVSFESKGEKREISADFAVIAVPAPVIPNFMPNLDEERLNFFSSTGYVGHHIAYFSIESNEKDLPHTLTLPSVEGFDIVSNLHFVPHGENKYIVTCELKGKFCKLTLDATDDDILDSAWTDIIKAVPKSQNAKFINRYLQRNDLAICRRETGYVKRLKKFKELEPISRVSFAGDYLTNSSVGQAHWSGLQAADELINRHRK